MQRTFRPRCGWSLSTGWCTSLSRHHNCRTHPPHPSVAHLNNPTLQPSTLSHPSSCSSTCRPGYTRATCTCCRQYRRSTQCATSNSTRTSPSKWHVEQKAKAEQPAANYNSSSNSGGWMTRTRRAGSHCSWWMIFMLHRVGIMIGTVALVCCLALHPHTATRASCSALERSVGCWVFSKLVVRVHCTLS